MTRPFVSLNFTWIFYSHPQAHPVLSCDGMSLHPGCCYAAAGTLGLLMPSPRLYRQLVHIYLLDKSVVKS